MVKVRPYKESDQTAVTTLWRAAFPNSPASNQFELEIQRKLAIQRQLFLVATLESDIVGTAMGGYDGHRGWVYFVAVSPDYQRRGIGTTLMNDLERRLIEFGCPKLNLQVRASNQSVVDFYKGLGYEIEERVSMGKRLG